MAETDPRDERTLSFSFGDAARSGRVVLELEDGTLTVGDRTLIADAEMWLERGEHVCLVGANGTGKTTLVETLTGNRELDSGKLRIGHNVEARLPLAALRHRQAKAPTVLAHAQRSTGLSEAKTRALLGRFLFSGEDVMKPVGSTLGRGGPAAGAGDPDDSDANLLILDEPTNHLDVESREALEDAFSDSRGRCC